jgi:hypothetical protein
MPYRFLLPFLLFLSGKSVSQTVFDAQPVSTQNYRALEAVFTDFSLYYLPSEQIAQLLNEQPDAPYSLVIKLPGLAVWNMDLQPRYLLKHDYHLRSDQSLETGATSNQLTWKGRISGEADSKISLTLSRHVVFGSIRTGGETWFIEPLHYLLEGAMPDLFVVYRIADVRPDAGILCGVEESERRKNTLTTGSGNRTENTCRHVELAIASAYDMWQRYGSVQAVEIHNIGVINEVASDYDDAFDWQLQFVIAAQYVSTSPNSSLDSTLSTTNSTFTLLTKIGEWGETGNFQAEFDLGLLWTTRDICTGVNCSVIGFANIGGVCSSERYLVLEDYNGLNPSGTGYQLRVLTSHEIGHQFGCGHDNIQPPTIMYPAVVNTSAWATSSVLSVNDFLTTIGCLQRCGIGFSQPETDWMEGGNATSFIPADSPDCGEGFYEKKVWLTYSGDGTTDTLVVEIAGGTAEAGQDFIMPDSLLIIPAGAVSRQIPVTLHIRHDVWQEPDQTIRLKISGPSVNDRDTVLLRILDDDKDLSAQYYQYVETGQFNLSPLTAPFLGAYQDGKSQFIVTAAELSGFGLRAGDEIYTLEFLVSSKFSTQPYRDFTIGLKHTTNTIDFTQGIEKEGFVTVFSADYSTTTGWNRFDLTQPFIWDGISNLAVQCCFDNQTATLSDLVYTFSGGHSKALFTTSGNGCNLLEPISTIVGRRPKIRLHQGVRVASVFEGVGYAELKAGETAFFRDPQNDYLIAIKPLTETHDAGCVSVKIDRAGTGRQPIDWLPQGSFITDKTYYLSFDDPEGYFEISLFYKNEELAVWGPSAASLNIIKYDQAISEAGGQGCFIQSNLSRNVFGPAWSPAEYYEFKGAFKGGVGFALTNASMVTTRDAADDGVAEIPCLFPSPAQDFCRLQGIGASTAEVRFYNLAGQIVLQTTADASNPVSIGHLTPGLYITEILTAQGRVYRNKLMKG